MAGDSSAPQVQVLATLPLAASAWKAEWNLFGTTLGVASEDDQVCCCACCALICHCLPAVACGQPGRAKEGM
jgi:hypothetical protein